MILRQKVLNSLFWGLKTFLDVIEIPKCKKKPIGRMDTLICFSIISSGEYKNNDFLIGRKAWPMMYYGNKKSDDVINCATKMVKY